MTRPTEAAQATVRTTLHEPGRPLASPIYRSTTFAYPSSAALGAAFKAGSDRVYTRFGHPNATLAAERIAELERAEAALVFSSGMGAITTALLAVLRAGDHVVAQRKIFAQTFTFLETMAPRFGIETSFVDATILSEVALALRPNTRLIYIETPSNPLLEVVDIGAIAEIARSRGLHLFVDTTFASPHLQTPLSLGATLSLQSATKFLGGHSDLMAGVAAGSVALIDAIRDAQVLLGTIPDPHGTWLLERGVKTLGMRVERQCANALAIARTLETQPSVKRVYYPWLESSPQYAVARRQMRGGGGVVSFELEGGLNEARAFLDALETIPIATSLGGIETIVEVPYELDFSDDELGDAAAGLDVSPALIRLSVGIENLEDIEADLLRSFEALDR